VNYIKLLADICRGEILADMAERGERVTPETARSNSRNELDPRPTLDDLHTTWKEFANAQLLAGEVANHAHGQDLRVRREYAKRAANANHGSLLPESDGLVERRSPIPDRN